jgi:Phage integrase, N-terminal SAM-like domain
MSFSLCLIRSWTAGGEARFELGHPLVNSYLEFVAGRSRPNTLRAVAFDLQTFFSVVAKDPVEVVAADVFEFLADQRGDRTVIRLSDRESGLSARTIARRLSSVSGFYAYVVARCDRPVSVNPVPRGLSTRRGGGSRRAGTLPLVRVPRTLPRILSPVEVDRLLSALRTLVGEAQQAARESTDAHRVPVARAAGRAGAGRNQQGNHGQSRGAAAGKHHAEYRGGTDALRARARAGTRAAACRDRPSRRLVSATEAWPPSG